ncbi:MAG: tetratricopeptide repeat protein [Candidatus Absconditabacterales bacterium]
MILTIILISLPIGIISFFFSKKIFRRLRNLLGKIDTFDAFTGFRKKIVHLYKTKFSSIKFHINKKNVKDIHTHEEVSSISIDDIIKPRSSASKSLEPEIKIDEEEYKTTMIKKRKLLEKIIYDALGFRKDGKLDEYEKKIIEGLAIDSEDNDLNKLLAGLYFTMSNYKKALPILKKIVEMDPKDHKAIWQIGEIYLTSADFDIAELLIQKAIAINPTNPKYYISMVELYYNTDRKHDAITEMNKVIKLRPTNSAYMLTLADLYQEINDFDNAKKYYFRVLEYEPSNEKAKKKLKELVVE